jgi:formylglycine-generating enzyme required for sulfatase activity
VDWFDAVAYAKFVGKRLPTEAEWQRAAQGDVDRAFPWGNEFTDHCAQWIGRVLGERITDVHTWREALLSQHLLPMNGETGTTLTAAVDQRSGISPFGVRGLSGNAWEWTASNFFSRGMTSPDVGERDLLDIVYDWRSYPVIRGGSWSSLPELTSVAFRGRDLITDRHCENGFRCACDCAQAEPPA